MTGRAYAGRLTEVLDNLAYSTEQVRTEAADKIRILSTPGFAARWLMPRLPRFAFPQAIRLRIAQGAPSTDFASNDADVVIQWRDDPAPGLRIWPFLHSGRYPVAAPGFAMREKIEHPHDLLRVTLFQDETDDMWPQWFRAAGVAGRVGGDGPVYPNCEYATTAAEAGLGVALGYDAVVSGTVAEGRLTRLFEANTAPFVIYSIVCEARRKEEPLIKAFREWLLSESRADGTCPDPAFPKRRESHLTAINSGKLEMPT